MGWYLKNTLNFLYDSEDIDDKDEKSNVFVDEKVKRRALFITGKNLELKISDPFVQYVLFKAYTRTFLFY